MNKLFAVINSLYPVSQAFERALRQYLRPVDLLKGEFLLVPGQISRKMYFLEEGLIRGYYLKEDKDVTTGFMQEGGFVISPVSFYSRQPSFEYLELLEDSNLLELTKESLDRLYQEFIEFNIIGRLLTEQYYIKSELRTHHLRMLTADERYEAFVKDYAPLLNRLSNKHIASFLGITPETLSRIRAKKG